MNRLAATLALVVAIAVVIVIILGTRSPAARDAGSNQGQASRATTVQRRDLVQTDTESGTLSYADPRTVYDGLSGTITWLPAVGQVIKPGQALYDVGGVPVILMNGTTPAYRDLNSSDSDGPDILELNRNLVALGFNPDGIVVDDVWQPATTAGVELFQESLGESETGELKLGTIVFLPHNRVISTLDASLGSDGSGGASATSGRPAAGAEFVSLTKTVPGATGPAPTHHKPHKKKKKPRGASKTKTVAALLALLRAQSAELQAQSAELKAAQAGSHNPSGSGGGSPSGGRAVGVAEAEAVEAEAEAVEAEAVEAEAEAAVAVGAAAARLSSRRAPPSSSSPWTWTRPSRARPRSASRSQSRCRGATP